MSSGTSNKPIVFVFGAKKGDADGRKRNLSAINTQVAYRAHERRREKNLKSRQRAQAKEDGKAAQSTPTSETSAASSASTYLNTNLNRPSPQYTTSTSAQDGPNISLTSIDRTLTLDTAHLTLTTAPHSQPLYTGAYRPAVLTKGRRESDLSSDASSDQDATSQYTWPASPVSARQSTPATDVSSLSPLVPASIHSSLDPFFKLPSVASDRDKWLVQFYFREMGHVGFGTHSNSLFCPDRDWVSQYVSSKSLCFQWVLILAEEHLGRLGVLPDQTNTIERKAKAYGSMNSVLRSKSVNRDEGISGIMYAAIVDVARTSLHLTALDRLINETGGFEAFLDGPLGVAHPEHVATVYAFGRCPIQNLDDLQLIRDRFLNSLRYLYGAARIEQEEKRKIRNRRPWDTLGRQAVDGNGVLVPANRDEHFRYYIKAQQDCFASNCISQLLSGALDVGEDYSAQARHFAAMIQTLAILMEFEDSYLARAMFLKRLKYVAEMSSGINATTSQYLLSHAGLLLISAFVRQEVQTYFDRTKALAKGVKISKIVVDALKIFPLLDTRFRWLVVGWLRNWLCYNDQIEGAEFIHLQDADLENISTNVTRNWYSVRGIDMTKTMQGRSGMHA